MGDQQPIRPTNGVELLRRIRDANGRPLAADERTFLDAAIELAAKNPTAKLPTREEAIAYAVRALAGAALPPDDRTPRERRREARQAQLEQMLNELERLEREGRGRNAVALIARKYASDPRDPVELASLERKLRYWRTRRNFGKSPVGSAKKE